MNGLDPQAYLGDLLARFPGALQSDLSSSSEWLVATYHSGATTPNW
ncbi:transposase domain-containing protein [Kineobactrum salinum]|uniref:Transposase domain-containing protein n=1 Tax=Kineobactrum salinum TaxID=2708301 RepID=A0A6C0U6L1_9GAMM|nr:transposase domain-containing protein [Kineobactrum salinum]